jgi:hypothetical protein
MRDADAGAVDVPRWVIADEDGQLLSFDTDEALRTRFAGTPVAEDIEKAIAYIKRHEAGEEIQGDLGDGTDNVRDAGMHVTPVGSDCESFASGSEPTHAQLWFPLWLFGNSTCNAVQPYKLVPKSTNPNPPFTSLGAWAGMASSAKALS